MVAFDVTSGQSLMDDHGYPSRKCILQVLGFTGASFVGVAATAENLERYLYLPGWLWIVGGAYIAGVWAYQTYCKEGGQ
jgi:hypothetical protein